MNDEELIPRLRAAARRAGAPAETDAERDLRERALAEPLDDAFEARMTAQILASQRARAGSHAADAAVAVAASRPPLPVIALPARPSRRAPYAWIGGGLAAAACLALAVGRAFAPPSVAPIEAMPLYAMSVTGGQDTMRGADDPLPSPGVKAVTAGADAPLAVTLRPPTDVTGPLAVSLFAVRAGAVTNSHGAVRIAPTGAVEVSATMGELAGARDGDATLVVVIAREAAHVDARRAAESDAPLPGAAVARVVLHVVPAAPDAPH